MPDLPRTVAGLAAALRAGDLTSTALVDALLARADALDPDLGVYVTRYDDEVRAAAASADTERAAGRDRGPLHGIPIGVKDIVFTAEGPTTACSRAYGGGRAVDGTAMARLRAAGALVLGKTTTMEFAYGMPDPDEVGGFALPRNPWDRERWTGGSSSGSASGVAAGLFPAALGSDTGGSVRWPASWCGVSGLRSSVGRVPIDGVVPLAPEYDVLGPLAATPADCALMMDALTGGTAFSTALRRPARGLRVGIDRGSWTGLDGLDPAVAPAFETACAALADAGCATVEVQVPDLSPVLFGYPFTSALSAYSVHAANLRRRWADYGPSARMALARGALVSGADAVRAREALAAVRTRVLALLDGVDVLVTPTCATGALRLDEWDATRHGPLVCTLPWALLRLPAASVPMGLTGDGLPLGLQVIGAPDTDETVLQVAALAAVDLPSPVRT